MRRTLCTAIVVIITALTFLHREQAGAAEPAGPLQTLEIRQLSLFKNGLGFFVGQVTCPETETSLQIALPVAPSHGTLWISYPSDLPLAGIVAGQVDSVESVEAITIEEMLRANVGRKVRLMVQDKEITGRITHIARDRGPLAPNPYGPGRDPAEYAHGRPWQLPGLITLETDAGELSLNPATVTQMTVLDGPANRRLAGQGKSAILRVRLKSPASGQKLTVSYLAKGVTWAPSYMVDISDEQNVLLSAKALIVNDACEIRNVDAHLVTGFPHLQFADVVSPIALKQNLAQFLQALSRGASERGRADVLSNVMTQRVAYPGMADQAAMPAYGAAEAGIVAEDLFLYPAGRLDLDRNEVAYVPLFTETVPCKHIYQWDIPDTAGKEGDYPPLSRPGGPVGGEEEVWHSLRLTNTTRVPWTTAPGETVKDGAILGQDTLPFTPGGSAATLRITRAVGVRAEQRELEIDRKREAVQMYGYRYELITVRGELSISNSQSKRIDMEITKTLSGEVKSSDPQARIDKLAAGLQRMNGLVKLTWNLQLNPKEKKDLSYTYDVYVRR